jgi:hypothetical protein
MQSTAAKEDQPDSARPPRNWRHRKQENARRRQETARRQQFVEGCITALGGPNRVTALQMVEIERAASLTLLAQDVRAKALRGETIDIGDMVRLEGALSRVLRSLNIPPPNAAAPVMTLHDHAAKRALERAKAPSEGSD